MLGNHISTYLACNGVTDIDHTRKPLNSIQQREKLGANMKRTGFRSLSFTVQKSGPETINLNFDNK